MNYHLTGLISSALFLLSVLGLWIQLSKIWDEKHKLAATGSHQSGAATAIISLNFMLVAFLGYFAMFFYGFALTRFNHYLVWPRFSAMILTLLILWELMRDRRNRSTKIAFFGSLAFTALGLFLLGWARDVAISGAWLSQLLIVGITIGITQSNLHQIFLIWRSGSTGNIALRSHQLTFLKDIGTISFGLAMGLASGWPLLLLCGTSMTLKLTIMFMFRWVRISDVAAERRELSIAR